MEKHKKTIDKKGFTLIELLATLAVLSLVASIVLYTAVNIIDNSKEKTYEVTINNIEKAASNYVVESIPYLTWIRSEGIEYQCVTIENLIEKGYFDNDILSSEIKKDTKVTLDDTIYIERDSNKTITKSHLLAGNAINYSPICKYASITSKATPKGWAKEKELTIYFNLFNVKKENASDYKYEYTFEEDIEETIKPFDNRSVEKKLTINKNGNLLAKIYNSDGNEIESHTRYIDKVDNEGPIINFDYNGPTTVRNSVIVSIEIIDNGSGVNYDTFGLNDIEVKIGSKTITSGLSLIPNEDKTYDLKIENNYDIGNLSITIPRGKILDNAENENVITTYENITFDNTYTISYKANGGTGSMSNTTCTYGKNCSVKDNSFTRTGYTFQGWTTNSDGTDDGYNWTDWSGIWKYKDNESGITDGELILYAKWTPNTYTITLNNQSATTAGTSKVWYQYNTTKTINGVTCYYYTNDNLTTCLSDGYKINVPTKTGYAFGGYYTSTNGSGIQYVNNSGTFINNIYQTTGNKTLYATWNAYLDLNGCLDGSILGNITNYGTADVYINGKLAMNDTTDFYQALPYGSTYEIKDIKTSTGKTYKGVKSGALTGTIGENETKVLLSFETNKYTISYNANGGSGAPSSQTKTYGKSLTLSSTKPTRTGYIFLKWNTKADGSGIDYDSGASYTSNSANTLYAIWKANSSNCKNNYDQYSNEILYFTRDNVTCYNEPSTSSGNKLGFNLGWCDDWMNKHNGDNDPNYITVRKTGISGWYYSVSYCCYVPSSDLRTDIDNTNNRICPQE